MDILTIAEVAAEAKVSSKTVKRDIAAGRLVTTRIRGCVRIARSDLDAYLTKCRSDATVKAGKYEFSIPTAGLPALLRIGQTRSSTKRASSAGSKIIALGEFPGFRSPKPSSDG